MKKKTIVLGCFLAVVLLLAGGFTGYAVSASAAGTAGTQSDPLATLSYLQNQLTPSLLNQFNGDLNKAVSQLRSEIQGGGGVTATYQLVTLSDGQKLTGQTGTEVLLRSGTVTLQGGVALLDTTGGNTLAAGSALTANHLCLFADSGGVVQAAGTATLLVRGSFTLG